MPFSRRQPRIASGGRVTLRLTVVQRDRLLASPALPKNLGHLLHRAPVREGRLGVRVTRAELAALIAAAAEVKARDDREERALGALLRYLETQEERFEDVSEEP